MNRFRANVQGKIPCIYELKINSEKPSNKRSNQNYNVEASNLFKPDIYNQISNKTCLVTEKIDGTCSFIQKYREQPWLWLRHDRKPVTSFDKKTKIVNNSWNVETDYKEAPQHWCPSKSCLLDGELIPDPINGHLIGWVPLDPKSRQHCWHLDALNEDLTEALILSYNFNKLTLSYHLLEDLLDTSLELIGTNINANPYKLGSKKCPLHFFIIHGSIPIEEKLFIDNDSSESLSGFFNTVAGQVEGIVWYTDNGAMYKLHRHHLKLKWPIDQPHLCTLPVLVKINDFETNCTRIKALVKLVREFANLSDFSKDYIKIIENI